MPSQCPIRESSLEGWLAKSATLVQSPCDPVDGLLPLPAGDRGERHVSDKAAPKDNIGFKVSQPGEDRRPRTADPVALPRERRWGALQHPVRIASCRGLTPPRSDGSATSQVPFR